MRGSRWLVAGLFVASTVVVVSAQQPGGGFVFGGKGGSVVALVATSAALQDELKVTDAQKEKLKGISEKIAEAGKKRGEAFKEAAGDKEKMKDLFAGIQKETEANNKLVEALLTADQKARVKQIDRQMAGVRAFTNDELVADLKMNDTQKTKVKGIVEEYTKDTAGLGGGFGKGGFDKEKLAEAQKKREKLTKGALADIDEVLTDDQRKSWKEMVGPEFDRSKLFGGFGTKGKGTPKKTD